MDQYRKSPRCKFHDYDGGNYFITICTKDKKHFFGEIYNSFMHYTDVGRFAFGQLENVSSFRNDIIIPVFTVMPNHIHAIISVKGPVEFANDVAIFQRSALRANRPNPDDRRHVPLLSRYISSFKGAVSKFAQSLQINFGWQSRYYDHIIRNNRDGNLISEYIMTNVTRWETDCYHNYK